MISSLPKLHDAKPAIREIKSSKPMETNQHVISASTIIATSRKRAYSILADYRIGHPSILPHQFTSMEVEQGGVGAGTIIRFTMRCWEERNAFVPPSPSPNPDGFWLRPTLRPTAQ
jgi:hypothetical protein